MTRTHMKLHKTVNMILKSSRTIHVRSGKDQTTFEKELELISLVDTY